VAREVSGNDPEERDAHEPGLTETIADHGRGWSRRRKRCHPAAVGADVLVGDAVKAMRGAGADEEAGVEIGETTAAEFLPIWIDAAGAGEFDRERH